MSLNLLLSVIVPVYNCEKYISDCLSSIVSDIDEEECELILINDGSTDNTREIVKKFKGKNIKFYDNENHGVSYSRNFGISKAKGKFLMFVDADDVLDIGWYEMIKKDIESNEDFIIYTSKNIDTSKIYNYITGFNSKKICLGGPFSRVIKSKIVHENNILFDEHLINGEDMIFNCMVLNKCSKIKVVYKSFYLYRNTPNSLTKKFDERIFENDYRFNTVLADIIPNQKEIISFSKMNGLYTILDRISYCKSMKSALRYFEMVNKSFYFKDEFDKLFLSNFVKVIVWLYSNRRYKTVYCVLKLKNKFKNLFKGKENFVRI